LNGVDQFELSFDSGCESYIFNDIWLGLNLLWMLGDEVVALANEESDMFAIGRGIGSTCEDV
jgi:hypothetical protein